MTQSKERVMGEEGLYRSSFEHDNCGIGAVVNIKGEKSHATVENALKIVENLEHRAGKDAEGKTGDGVGILLQISHKFFSKACSTLGFSLGGEREYGVGVFFFPQNELKRNQAKKISQTLIIRYIQVTMQRLLHLTEQKMNMRLHQIAVRLNVL